MKSLLIALLLFLLPLLSFTNSPKKNVLILQQSYHYKATSRDTVFVQYGEPATGYHVNDSIRIKCGADTSNITTIFIANPGYLLREMSFAKRFPRLKHLILAGDDADYLDSVRYDFFNCPALKLITFSSVYMNDGPDNRRGYVQIKRFIHAFRPDIRIRFKPMGRYNDLGWPDY